MDTELAEVQKETMKKEAAAREKEVQETQASALEKIYRDLRDKLKDAKADDGKDEIERINKELGEIRKMRVELVTKQYD